MGTLGRSPLSAAAANHPPLPTQQARTRPLPAVTTQTNDMAVTLGILPDHPSQGRDRGSAGEAVEGSYCNPSLPPRPSVPVRTGGVNNSVRVRSSARLSPSTTTSSGQTDAYRAWCASNTMHTRDTTSSGIVIHSITVNIHTKCSASSYSCNYCQYGTALQKAHGIATRIATPIATS